MANRINAAKNLTKRGAEANPNGRPKKGYSITEMMKEMLGSKPEVKRAIGESIAEKAQAGDIAAQKMLWQYMDGMPMQGIELGGTDGGAITVKIEGYGDSDITPAKTKESTTDS